MIGRLLGAIVGLSVWVFVLAVGLVIMAFAAADFLPLVRPVSPFDTSDLAQRGVDLSGIPGAPRMPEGQVEALLLRAGSIKLVIGLAVFLVGLFGLVARVRRGVAGRERAPATSPLRRGAAICVFAFGIGVALYGVPGYLADLAGSGAHVFAGLRVEGTVEARREIVDPQTGDVRYTLLEVSFSPSQRRLWKKTLKVAPGAAGDPGPGAEIALVYPIHDAQDVRLAETLASPLALLWPFVWRAVFIVVGIRGIRRNWPARGPSAPDTGGQAGGHAGGQAVGKPSPALVRRGGFGRRGAGG